MLREFGPPASGPTVLDLPGRSSQLMVSGEFVVETFGYDCGRQVTAYLPPNPPEAVVFAADGQGISQWAAVLERWKDWRPP